MIAEFIFTNHSRAQKIWILGQSCKPEKQKEITKLEKQIENSYKDIF